MLNTLGAIGSSPMRGQIWELLLLLKALIQCCCLLLFKRSKCWLKCVEMGNRFGKQVIFLSEVLTLGS